ncbi:MAG: Ig-like domain-containing protein [Spirochaetales bacterium]|nr:Ig-like domain-containing protein [Spirochaetales bacterium]
MINMLRKTGIVLTGAFLFFMACQNPVDILEEATDEVMEANNRFLEITAVFPESSSSDNNASTLITVDFDREIDQTSLSGNITLLYAGDETNYFLDEWADYDNVLNRLSIDVDPWMDSNKTVTLILENLTALDGSVMQEAYSWSFSTNTEAAFRLTIDADYVNLSNYTAVPLDLAFSTSSDLWYHLSTNSSLTSATVPAFNPSNGDWTEVSATEMTDTIELSTEGVSVPVYLWVYDNSSDGLGLLSTNKTETDYVALVDITAPVVSAGSDVYANSAYTITAIASDENGIASYLWTGPGDCDFSTTSEASTDVSSTTEGTKELTLTVTDTAGNSASDSVNMIWDVTPPDALTIAPDLDNDYDSGESDSDNITNETTGLIFTGSSEANGNIELYADSTLMGTATADGSGNWTCTADSFSSGEDTYEMIAFAVDRAGNRSDPSPALSLTIDTVAQEPDLPDLYYLDDSGASSSDNLTYQTSGLTILVGGEANAYLEYEEYTSGASGSFYLDASGSGSFDLPTLTTDDIYEVETHQTDVAGNSSSWSNTLSIEIDTTSPTVTFSLPSTTYSSSVTASFSSNEDLWRYAIRNDGSSTWNWDYTPEDSESLTIRNNAGNREVYCYAYDRAGNWDYVNDTTNYLMPVNVQLYYIKVGTSHELGEEDWFWNFDLNHGGDSYDAFSRSSFNSYPYDITGFLNEGTYIGYVAKSYSVNIPAVSGDANSAVPYTYTAYVDVSEASGALSISGYLGEYDGGKIDQRTYESWFTYITTDASTMDTSSTSTSYGLTDGTYLTDVSIGVKYWASVSYASLGS